MSIYTFEIKTGLLGLESIKKDWNRIYDSLKSKHFYESYGWYYCYTKSFKPDLILFYCIFEGDQIISIIPLEFKSIQKNFLKINILQSPDNDHLMFNGILLLDHYNPNAIIAALIKHLINNSLFKWHMIKLSKILSLEGIYDNSITQIPNSIVYENKQYHEKIISLTDADRAIVSKSLFKSIKKHRNRLEKAGEYSFKPYKLGQENLSHFEDFLDIEASGWKGQSGSHTAIKLFSELDEFYRSLINNFSNTTNIYIFELTLNETLIATAYMILDRDTAYGCKIGYDENYSEFAPGKMLHYYILLFLKNDLKITKLNFTSNAQWQNEWGVRTESIRDINIYNNTVFSKMLYLSTMIKRILYKFFKFPNN